MKRVFYTTTLLLISLLGLYSLMTHPFIKIQSITYSGNNYTSLPRLKKSTQPLVNKPIFCIFFLKTFKQDLYKQHPALKTFDIQAKSLTQIHIKITEKEGWVAFTGKDSTHIISKDGAVLNTFSENTEIPNIEKLIIVHGRPELHPHTHYISSELHKHLHTIVENIHFYLPLEKIQINFQNKNNLLLIKNDILEIKIGTIDYLDLKFRNLNYFLEYYKGDLSSLSYIDLRVEDRIIIKEGT
ncbi:hypothetical protein DID77_02470 [Candidatus Marinamargulisbacteria bacterium SCGC AG-439-L15]|nr:hypothetical protein DID77_02470 [Candidatus Marinamargulisbacteria bacterium SCGC AG-439-L15]